MRSLRLVVAAAMLLMVMVACSSGTPAASQTLSPSPASGGGHGGDHAPTSATPTPAVTTPIAQAVAAAPAPTSIAVTFSGLRAGTYPVHLHSICSGRASFHITVVQSLVVGAAGRGTIAVPSSYFGRGLCLIVYSSPSLSAVLTTRRI
jgi:hypothetical protein